MEHLPTYSTIIRPEDYNRLMSKQHLYIAAADRHIVRAIHEEVVKGSKNIVELGCGPARLLKPVEDGLKGFEGVQLTGVDHDLVFLEHALSVIDTTRTRILQVDARVFLPELPVDVFYSQGFHHHVQKGEQMEDYLANVYRQLSPQGFYLVGDEFLPEYKDAKDRLIKAVIWYSHIIAHAKKKGFTYLAQEEAKTLLDDLQEGQVQGKIKTSQQIDLILKRVVVVDQCARSKNLFEATRLADELLDELESLSTVEKSGDPTVDLSRGDYKISRSVFEEEVVRSGFKVDGFKSFGPMDDIGAMGVYKLSRSI